MAAFFRCAFRSRFEIRVLEIQKCIRCNSINCYSDQQQVESAEENDDFRVLKIKPVKVADKEKKEFRHKMSPPRAESMSVDQDWTNVWPAPRSFHPAVVPLPLRQGVNKHGPAPHKYANAELMKIPNFLHLTPPAIKKHCEALKNFCTPWPKSLKTEKDIEKHFPVEIIYSDYCHSSPTIRDPMSRIVSLKVKVKSLELDDHAKDKFLRLVGERYDPKTDIVTITTDSCPMKKQNYEYAHYLLTALVYESCKFEEWEKHKMNEDMETYIYSKRQSSENVKKVFEYNNTELPDTTEFAKAVEDWHNNGDSRDIIEKYKKASLELLSLPAFQS